MILNIVLFDNKSVSRIAKRALEYFADSESLQTSNGVIWLDGLYFKFYPRQVVVNLYDINRTHKIDIYKCLASILEGEEVSLSDFHKHSRYIEHVNKKTILKLPLEKVKDSYYEAN